MSKTIEMYIRENISIILRIIIVYMVGLAIGIALFIFSNIGNEYTNDIINIFEKTKQENFEGINIISNGIRNNVMYISILYMTLITIVAPFIICMLLIIKAAITGIYICSMFAIFGFFKGTIVCFVCTILPLLFSLSGYIIICTNIISVFNNIKNNKKMDIKGVVYHLYYLIVSISLISFSIVVEQLLTGFCINFYINNI